MRAPERLPYPGLRAFAYNETDLFFGREDCVYDMVDRLGEQHFLAVLGASGSGKSSVVRTGLLNGLAFGLLATAGPTWRIADCHPGGTPLRNLAAALLATTEPGPPAPAAVDALEAFLTRGPRSLLEWVNDGNLPDETNLLILADQFEELFRYGDYAAREQAEAFVGLLLESAASGGPIYVVMTMRSEYLGACALIPGLAEQINTALYLTRRMTREECRAAIEGPASVVGFDIEPALVSHLLNDLTALAPWEADGARSQSQLLSRQADQLPLMQHVLSRLWQLARRRSEGARPVLTLADYFASGQLGGTLDQHANEIRAQLSAPAQAAVSRVFRALVSGTSLVDAVRKPMRFADLVAVVGAPAAVVREVVDAFRARDCNFLRGSDDGALADDTLIDISHESLIRQWTSLATWFQEEAQSSELWARLVAQQARHAAGAGELLSGLDLANARAWWDREQPAPGWAAMHGGHFNEVAALLHDSREREEQAAQAEAARAEQERLGLKRRTMIYAGFAALCLLIAGASVTLYVMLNETTNALAKRNAELDIEKQLNEKALGDARVAAAVAQQERHHAQIALQSQQEANTMSLSAADQFVVGFARSLRNTPGVSTDEVQRWLREGENYLDDLSRLAPDAQRTARVRAGFALAGADTLLQRRETADAWHLIEPAESRFIDDFGATPRAPDDTLLLADMKELEVDILNVLGRNKDAEVKAQEALQLVTPLDDELSGVRLGKAKAEVALSSVFVNQDAYELSVEHAKNCLRVIDSLGSAQTDESWYYRERCDIDTGYSLSKLNKSPEDRPFDEDAVKAARMIEHKTIPMRRMESSALSNLAFDIAYSPQSKADTVAKAERYFIEAAHNLDLPAVDMIERPGLRLAAAEQDRYVADFLRKHQKSTEAVEWYDRAYEAGTLKKDAWRKEPLLANELHTILSNEDLSLANLDWETDKALLAKIEDVRRNELLLLQHLIGIGRAEWCQGCELHMMEDHFATLIRMDRVRGEDRSDEAMTLADETIRRAKETLATPPTPRHAIHARRAWFWTITWLPDAPDQMPSISNAPDRQIARLEASRAKAEEFLKTYPGVWFAERKLGSISASLAGLYAARGARDEALRAALTGASMFNKASVKLLADWYRTGSGPVAQDAEKAKYYDGMLAARNWEMKRYTVYHTKLTWFDGNETTDWNVYIENPRAKDDDPVARELRQLQMFEAVQIPANVGDTLGQLLTIAKDKKVDFIQLVDYALKNTDSIAASDKDDLQEFLAKENFGGAAERLIKIWNADKGVAKVTATLESMLETSSKPGDLAWKFSKLANEATDHGGPSLAEAIVDIILKSERIDMRASAHARMYRIRAWAKERQGNTGGAEMDRLAALALNPDDPLTLNTLAWSWVDADRQIPEAIDLLERAVKLAPDDALIRDSLGWADVKAGKTETGLDLLKSASAADPQNPEILFHLGDTYRRLGRNNDAFNTLSHAVDLAKDPTLQERIVRQLALVRPG